MPTDPSLPPKPSDAEIARQKLLLGVIVTVLVVGAGLIIFLAKSIPLPMRLLAASMDIILAAVLWLLSRQKLSGK